MNARASGFRTIDKWGEAEFATEVAIRQDRHGTTVSIEQDDCFVMIGAKELPRLIKALLAADREVKTVRLAAKKIGAMMNPRAVR